MKLKPAIFAALLTVLGIAVAAVDPAVKEMFDKIDTDGDGSITKQEFGAQPELINETHLHGYGCFEQADVNQDGALSLEEYDAYEEEIPCE
jgi:Ca2+-binding EF-hand superfamily protein